MLAYADTSFLFALVVHDINSAAARNYVRGHRQALPFTSLQRCELRNAIRLAVFRRHTDTRTAKAALNQVNADIAAGNLASVPLAWPDTLDAAESLSEAHTTALGVRTLDLLHIGAALTLGLRTFLTFDRRQYICASAAGLRVEP